MPNLSTPLPSVNADAVTAEIEAMLAAEGVWHCEGTFIPCLDRAARQRRLVAERRVRDAERKAAWLAKHPVCVWCSMRIPEGMATTLVAGATIGACCVADYEATVFGVAAETLAASPLDETDVAAIEHESGIAAAYEDGFAHGESIGEQTGARLATFREIGRAA